MDIEIFINNRNSYKAGAFMEHSLDLVSLLRRKKIRVIEIPKWGPYLRNKWEESFANMLSEKEKQSIYFYDDDGFCGYYWHIFSYERRDFLKEDKADIALNKERKKSCYVFYQHSDEAYILENANPLAANDFINEEDIFIVDKEFSWTYVRTHETGWCGPYFCRQKSSI
jgi:hypothetical protein